MMVKAFTLVSTNGVALHSNNRLVFVMAVNGAVGTVSVVSVGS